MGKLGKHKTHGKAKIEYADWPEAVPSAARHSKDQKKVVSIYKCPTCGKYHIGQERESYD